jgi:hypothetical protein
MLLALESLNLVLEMQGIMHSIELHLAGKVLDTNCLAKTIKMSMTGNQYFLSSFLIILNSMYVALAIVCVIKPI